MSAARDMRFPGSPVQTRSLRGLAPGAAGLTRREFLQTAGLASALALAPPALSAMRAAPACLPSATQPLSPQARPSQAPIVSFFNDQPYLDFTGDAHPYVPPVGLRAAVQPSAEHMESLFHIC
jgi:hypothetical protein